MSQSSTPHEKIARFKAIILEYMDETEVFYLENDPVLAYEAKYSSPSTGVYLVGYKGYHEI
jgi:hypothetical protein